MFIAVKAGSTPTGEPEYVAGVFGFDLALLEYIIQVISTKIK